MQALQGVNLSSLKVAKGGDRVYKDECIYSFETPEGEGGLYVSLHNFMGVGRQWLELHHRKTGDRLFLHIKKKELPKEIKPDGEEPPGKKPTRLAIGVEGGFSGGIEKVEYEEIIKLVVFPGLQEIPLPCVDLPQKIQDSIASVIAAESASKQDAMTSWEDEERKVSKHADTLKQLDNGVQIPPSGWKCDMCDLTTNLWLNLTDGKILCGRRYFDGSGGNNHAVDHYDTTKYPLAVKLGTITPGGADVYSYDEDNMVIDPKLAEHLAHFGINMMIMNKTDKTMTELEIDINMRIGEWSLIQESGQRLKLLYGSGYTGLQNLGNSCYINSTMQVLFSLPGFKSRYYEKAIDNFTRPVPDPTKDFNTQMSKLAIGLLSGQYSQKPPEDPSNAPKKEGEAELQKEQKGIRPQMFKTLIGTGHREFSSNRQQDAQEFFLHLMNLIDRTEHNSPDTENVVDLFRYQVEEKIQCVISKKVRYSEKPELLLTLPVPMDMATNKDDVVAWQQKKAQLEAEKKRINPDEVVRAKVPFSSCLSKYSLPADIPDFYSSAVQAKSPATRTYRFSSFPDYLMVQLAKFAFDKSWEPVKFDVEVNVEEYLDLTSLRAQGILPGEELLPDGAGSTKHQEIDEDTVMQLASMGFSVEGCKRAVFNTGNQGVEPAMNWVLEHMSDPDFDTPFVPPGGEVSQGKTSSEGSVSEDGIAIVMSLGFTREQAIKALKATDNNIERAADWVFSHIDELQDEGVVTEIVDEKKNYRDGSGKYQLIAFISHMGTSTMSGHYVCHIKKEGRWVIFNDSKVAESITPPKDLGYLYLYKRDGP